MMSERAESAEADSAAHEPPPLRGLLAAGLEALATRLDLAAVELEIHLLGLLRTLVWAVAAMVCVLLALTFGVIALIATLWSAHRVLGLLAGGLTFVALAVLFGFLAARTFQRRVGILPGSLEQLERDRRQAGGSS
jgi:uncharacterized membrane protein YqjE